MSSRKTKIPSFVGFGTDAMGFFEALEANNSKATFTEWRSVYETQVRGPLEALLTDVATERRGTVRLFRPHNNRRFQKNAPPYKTTCYGVVHSVRGTSVGYYAELSLQGLYVARGFHDMAKDQLGRFREAVADARKGSALEQALAKAKASKLSVGGEALKSAPRGVAADHPRVRLLRQRALVVGRTFAPGRTLRTRRVAALARQAWEGAEPVARWLHRHVGETTIPPEVRYGPKSTRR
ncbi:MAG: DUF2461 family protein [Myxococcota bacterium]